MAQVGKGVNTVVEELLHKFSGAELLALSGNYCTDKKPSAVNWIEGRGVKPPHDHPMPPPSAP